MTQTPDRPFSGIQFYMANTGMTVHVLLDQVAPMPRSSLNEVIARVLAQAPQLAWRERPSAGGYVTRVETPDPASVLVDLSANAGVSLPAALDAALRAPLTEGDKPSFQVLWQPGGDDGVPPLLCFHTTHGILEGADVAGILRGRSSEREKRDTDDLALPAGKRFWASVLVPFVWVLHLLIARFETRDSADFGYRRLTMDRPSVKAAAERLGISQRALLFALVSETYRRVRKPGKPLSVIYSTLPTKRARLVDDEYMNVRTDEVQLKPRATLVEYAGHVDQVLKARGPNPLFLATLQRKLLRLHRWVHARAPWIFPRKFFGFSPQDLILSMIPPVNPARFDRHLAGATLYAGSNTGTASNCIFVPSDRAVGLTFYTDIPADVLAETLRGLCAELDVSVQPARV